MKSSKKLCLGGTLVLTLLAVCGAFSLPRISRQESELPDILDVFPIGYDNNQIIFVLITTPMNWAMARETCALFSFTVAGITSKARADILVTTLNQNEHLNETMIESLEMWTSARESRDFRMFRWENEDGRSEPTDESAVDVWSDNPVRDVPYQFCGTLSVAGNRSTVLTRLCSDFVSGVVCVTK